MFRGCVLQLAERQCLLCRPRGIDRFLATQRHIHHWNLYMLRILKLLVRLGNMKLLAPSLSQHPSTRLTSLSERLII